MRFFDQEGKSATKPSSTAGPSSATKAHPSTERKSGTEATQATVYNCSSGTVVDREVVHPTQFDFYLQSHHVPRGTARPAHYSVLYDENDLTADTLQAFSFALCHVYARSNRAVSIPAPVHYADQVCYRVRNHSNPNAPIEVRADPEAGSSSSAQGTRTVYEPPHDAFKDVMYFV